MGNCIKLILLIILPISVTAQQGNPDSLRQALKIAVTDSARFSILGDLENYYLEINRQTALFFTDQRLSIAKKNNHTLDEALTLDRKGYILMHLGKYPESLRCFQQAFKIAEDPDSENKTWYQDKKSTPRKFRLGVLASIHHDLGHLMGNTNNTDQQIFQYKETKRLAEESGEKGLLGLVNMNLGNAYLTLNKLDSALVFEKNAEQIFKQIGFKKYISFVYEILGSVYFRKGNKNFALQYFHKGVNAGIEQNNFESASICYSDLTNYYLSEKQKDSSLYYAKKELETLHFTGSKDLGEAYENLYQSYKLSKELDSAYKYQGLALIAKDSSYQTTIKSLTEFQKLSFKEQLRLQELEQEKEVTQNRIRTYAMLSGLGVILLVVLILYRNNRQKQKANKVLETTLTNLKATQSQLIQSEKMASLGELTAGIAHEIQNPLNFVNNFSEVSIELIDEMQDAVLKSDREEINSISADIKTNLQKIVHHGKRADTIVKGMLQHSRSSSGVKEPTDINKLADEYLRLAYHGLRAKDNSFNATMKTDYDETIGNINIIPQDIGRVILNLITNAFYAVTEKKKQPPSPEGEQGKTPNDYEPIVTVTTKRIGSPSGDGGKIEIRVSDNGNGIPQKVLDKIFQPFFTTKPTGQGTGLGLSLSYDIVKAHGGELKVETKEGEGSEFIILLQLV